MLRRATVISMLSLLSPVAFADSGDLRRGMSYVEVARVLGAPEEQREFETKREVVWVYKNGEQKIFFKEGKVVAWSNMSLNLSALPAAGGEGATTTAVSKTGEVQDRSDDAIQNLLGELTSDSSSPSSGAASNGAAKED